MTEFLMTKRFAKIIGRAPPRPRPIDKSFFYRYTCTDILTTGRQPAPSPHAALSAILLPSE